MWPFFGERSYLGAGGAPSPDELVAPVDVFQAEGNMRWNGRPAAQYEFEPMSAAMNHHVAGPSVEILEEGYQSFPKGLARAILRSPPDLQGAESRKPPERHHKDNVLELLPFPTSLSTPKVWPSGRFTVLASDFSYSHSIASLRGIPDGRR